jgi:hypothetical protein
MDITSTSAPDTTATLLPVIPEQDSHPTNPLDASEPVPLTTEPSNFTQEETASAPVTESKHYDAGYVPRHLKRVLGEDNKWTYEEVTESQDKDIYHDLSTFPDGTSS